jgi:hypothetical protein
VEITILAPTGQPAHLPQYEGDTIEVIEAEIVE